MSEPYSDTPILGNSAKMLHSAPLTDLMKTVFRRKFHAAKCGLRRGSMAFEDTRWSLVLRAGVRDDGGKEALEALCKQYWAPLYSFLRAKGCRKEDAADLLQGFFVHVLEKELINRADPAIGRFRSYLLTVLTRYAANEHAKRSAQKRGGQIAFISIDGDGAEAIHSRIPLTSSSPQEIYERQWALNVLNQAVERLGASYRKAGKGELFDALRPVLVAGEEMALHEDIAARLQMKVGAVRVAAHRLRGRFREALVEVVAETVGSPDDVDAEIRELFEILGRPPGRV